MSAFNPLDHPICLAYPLRLAPSDWTGHVPFAMYLIDILRPKVFVEVGTHNGVSYCSFCQAVKELKVETRCYAIGNRQGDEQAGFYGPRVLADLKEHHDPLYGGFSRLIQTSFDEAAAHFENGIIDLLHLDGSYAYEAVKHDFETWLPKMSEEGVVLLHDINVREGKFGVWRFWKTLRRQYPHFEFLHSHGLGLAAVGKQSAELLRDLLNTSKEDQGQIREIFHQLGTRLEITQELQTWKRSALAQSEVSIKLQETLEASQGQISSYEAHLRQVADELSVRAGQLEELKNQLAEAPRQSELYSFQLSRQTERLSEALAQISGLESQLTKSDKMLAEARRRKLQKNKDLNNQLADSRRQSELHSDKASFSSNGSAHLQASPDDVWVVGSVGTTEICWDTGDGSEGQVYVSMDDEPESLFVTGPRGSEPAEWITAGASYEFRLYAGTEHDLLLDKVSVTGRAPAPEIWLGSLDIPAAGSSATRYLQVNGWAHSTEAPISYVEAFLDNVPLGLVRFGALRPDVAESIPQVPIECGFSGKMLIDEVLEGRRTLTVRVRDDRGNTNDFCANVTIEHPVGESLALRSAAISVDALSASKSALVAVARISLDSLLASRSTVDFPSYETPAVSIILVLYNRAELTLQCLYSILRSDIDSYEVIIVDNASTDETPRLLKQIRGARIIQNETNLHFLKACNQAAKKASGKYVLLLNNDSQLVPGSISSAVRTLNSSNDIGAVGGKIILPDGTLQEAGSIIWQDGSCLGYGRGDSPFDPQYMFKRDADYCSAAFLITSRELFLEEGGFDEDYSPAYYEETDYCVRLWKRGKRVVYDPNVIIFHYEFASSTSQSSAIGLQIAHRKIFVSKHGDWLPSQFPALTKNILVARSRQQEGQRRILFLDDRVPHTTLGSGYPRSNSILSEMLNLGHDVTFYPTNFPTEDWTDVYRDIPSEVEVMLDHGWEKLKEFLSKRHDYYDLIFVSRPHNMASLRAVLNENPNVCRRARLVYDAEALFSHREIKQKRLEGQELSKKEEDQLIKEELSLTENCDCVVSVSSLEGSEFSKYGCENVYVLSHAVEVAPTADDFDERSDILFVGAIHYLNSPNADSMIWFSRDILPLIQKSLGKEIKLIIAGLSCSDFRDRIDNDSVQFVGQVDDLTPLYNRARIFVAPTRFSAGIPLKVCEAAGFGLPTVATSLTGLQLGWNNERELLLADDPPSFAAACVRLYSDRSLWNQLRENMINRVSRDFSAKAFSERLKLIIG